MKLTCLYLIVCVFSFYSSFVGLIFFEANLYSMLITSIYTCFMYTSNIECKILENINPTKEE
jgi:hypothetical protein